MTLGIPSSWKGTYGLKAAQACSLQNTFPSCLVFILHVRLSHIITPHVLLANSGRHLHSLNEFSEKFINFYTTIWATQLFIAVYAKQRSSSFAKESSCKEVFFATAVVNHILHHSLSSMITSPSTVSSEASSLVGSYWSVTCPKIFLCHLFLIPRFFPLQ